MKLSCIRYHKDLAAYVDGELSSGRAEGLERHTASCPACRGVLADLRRINALAPPPQIAPSADFDRVFWTKLARERERQEAEAEAGVWQGLARSFLARPVGLAVSACLALGVLVVTMYLVRPAGNGRLQHEIMAAAELDMYANLDVIQNSEALEHFELIEMLDAFYEDGKG